MEKLTNIFKTLSDPNRLRILKMLEQRPLCVCEIKTVLGLASSTVSKHLSILKENGFLFDDKDGKWVIYRLKTDLNDEYLRYLLPLLRGWINLDELVRNDQKIISNIKRSMVCSRSEK